MRYGELAISSASLQTTAYPCYTVALPVAGEFTATADDTASVVRGRDGLVVTPGSRVLIDYRGDECVVRTVQFDTDVVCAELSALLARPVAEPPRFEFALTGDGATTVQRAVSLLGVELDGGALGAPVLADRIGRVVVAGLLLHQPHSQSAALQTLVGFEGSKAIDRVVQAIESGPMAYVTAGDLAAVAGLSVRSLEEGFRRHIGLSPIAYLRQVRMSRAHDALRSADPSATTATTIAHDWGFAHYGRFAAEYRLRYGIGPAHTLRSRA